MTGNKFACLSDEHVAAYIESALNQEELLWVEAHLPSCATCQNRVEMVRTAVAEDVANPERIERGIAEIQSIRAARKGRLN